MSGSPTSYLLWSVLSCIFLALLVVHLWLYDRFSCLRWDSGRQPGAFKRVMTYSYLGTLPTLICFSVAMTVLKFDEGSVLLPNGQVLARPFSEWKASNRHWLFPLFLTLSVSWSLEMVTHLEELTFWLFLLHQGPGKRDWFHSWEFQTWSLGSFAAVIGMPLTALVTRYNLTTSLGWIFLVGSLVGFITTVCFLYVIFRFPKFLDHVKAGGADPDVIVRLVTFYQLNCIRVVFRFVFCLPLLLLGFDAIKGPYPIISNPFALDFLLMAAGIGSFISSGITLLVFFPRSITHESGYQVKIISPKTSTIPPGVEAGPEFYHDHHQGHVRGLSNPISALDNPASPASTTRIHQFRFPRSIHHPQHSQNPPALRRQSSTESEGLSLGYDSDDGESLAMAMTSPKIPVQHSQSQPGHGRTTAESISGNSGSKTKSDDTMWEEREQAKSLGHDLPAINFRRHSDGPFVYQRHTSGKDTRYSQDAVQNQAPAEPPESQLHPYLLHFTSPIDLLDESYYDKRRADV